VQISFEKRAPYQAAREGGVFVFHVFPAALQRFGMIYDENGKDQWTPERNAIGSHACLLQWDPMASSSAKSCRNMRTVHYPPLGFVPFSPPHKEVLVLSFSV
jgi:hypothetical protein